MTIENDLRKRLEKLVRGWEADANDADSEGYDPYKIELSRFYIKEIRTLLAALPATEGQRTLSQDWIDARIALGRLAYQRKTAIVLEDLLPLLGAYEKDGGGITAASNLADKLNQLVGAEGQRTPERDAMPAELEALYFFHRKLEAEGFKWQCAELWGLLERLHLRLRAAAQPPGMARKDSAKDSGSW